MATAAPNPASPEPRQMIPLAKGAIVNERIGFEQRFIAALIDGAAMFIVGELGGIVFILIVADHSSTRPSAVGRLLFGAVVFGGVYGMRIVGVVWSIWEGLTGQALGKRLMKIRIKAADGSNAGVCKLLARAAVKYSFALLNLLALLIGPITYEPSILGSLALNQAYLFA